VCSGNGECVGEDRCECRKNYGGDECDIYIEPCTLSDCGAFGSCVVGVGTCTCLETHTGVLCDEEKTPPNENDDGLLWVWVD